MRWLLVWLAALALLGVVAFVSLWGDREAGGPLLAPAPEARAAGEPDGAAEPVRPAAEPVRRELGQELPPGDELEHAPAAGVAPTRLIGRCVEVGGLPLGGVDVQCLQTRASVVSGADGRFALELDLPGTWPEPEVSMRIHKIGFAAQLLQRSAARGATTDLGDLVLVPGAAISGSVLDASGRGIGGARVLCSDRGPLAHHSRLMGVSDGLVETRSDSTGAFRLLGVPAWPVRAWAQAEGYAWAIGEPLVVPPGEERSGVELVLEPLEPEDTIELLVLAPDGEPLAQAELSIRYQGTTHGGMLLEKTDEQGRYLHWVRMRVPHAFTATDPEQRFSAAAAPDVAPGARDVVLQLTEPEWLEVRVRDAHGEPVEDFRAQILGMEGSYTSYAPAVGAPPYAGGVARLMSPSDTFRVRVWAKGYAEESLGLFEPGSIESSLDVTLERIASVQGVVTAAGAPIAGVKVGLHRAYESKEREWLAHGFPARSVGFESVRAVSGNDGTFELDLRRSGSFYLRAEAEGWAPADLGPLDLSADLGASGLSIDLRPAGAIEGRLLLPAGQRAAGAGIGYSRGDGLPRTIAADGEGRYRIEGLTPGRWLLEHRRHEIRKGLASNWSHERAGPAGELPWSCEVREGETTRFDLDLRFEPTSVLRGRLSLGGEPAAGWLVRLAPAHGGGEWLHSSTDEEGRFRIETRPPGPRSLAISRRGSGGSFEVSDAVLLPEGESDWALDLPLGRVIATPTEAGFLYRWSGEGDLRAFVGSPEPDSENRVTLAVPAGAGTLESRLSEPIPLVVPAGGTLEIDL